MLTWATCHMMMRGGSGGLNRHLIKLFMRIVSHCLIKISLRIRNYGLNAVVLIRVRNKPMKHQDRVRYPRNKNR